MGTSFGLTFGGILLTAGLLYIAPKSVSGWDRADIRLLGQKWTNRVRKGPILDGDKAYLNYIAHPYAGALYYLQPRMAGFSAVDCAFYSFFVSTFMWEYGVEAFAEVPSWQDLVVTPGFGSLLGEAFYQIIRQIQLNDNEILGQWWLGKLVIWLLDPIGSLIYSMGFGEFLGITNKNAAQNRGVEVVTMPIIPNGKGRFGTGIIVRF